MNFEEALSKVTDTDAANAIKAHVKGLENRGAIAGTVTSAASSLGLQETDPLQAFNKILSDLQANKKALESGNSQLEALKATQVNLEGQLRGLRLEKTLSDASRIAGCQPEVLKRLVAGSEDKLKVEDGKVSYQGKDIKVYAETDEAWKPFLPALFPPTQTTTPAPVNPPVAPTGQTPPVPAPPAPAPVSPPLPSGGNNGNPTPKSLASSYLERTYPGLKQPQSA